MVTEAKEWRGRKGTELELPSGNVCLVRSPGMQTFIRAGVIPEPLVAYVRRHITVFESNGKKESMSAKDIDLDVYFEALDRVLLAVVIEPRVAPVPLDEEGEPVPFHERDDSILYVDEVDLTDKSFIFQFAVDGTRELEKFRNQQASVLEALQSGQGLGVPPEPAAGVEE